MSKQPGVILEVPKVVNQRIRWVRAEIHSGVVTCKDRAIKRDIESLKLTGGPPTSDPEPDWTLGRSCEFWLSARILERILQGTDGPETAGGVYGSPGRIVEASGLPFFALAPDFRLNLGLLCVSGEPLPSPDGRMMNDA
ncbi:MAG: hypothetical protein ACRD7E_25590, partial [Bryobacteraceae bacterium]